MKHVSMNNVIKAMYAKIHLYLTLLHVFYVSVGSI